MNVKLAKMAVVSIAATQMGALYVLVIPVMLLTLMELLVQVIHARS